jgi:hypothetical protein
LRLGTDKTTSTKQSVFTMSANTGCSRSKSAYNFACDLHVRSLAGFMTS